VGGTKVWKAKMGKGMIYKVDKKERTLHPLKPTQQKCRETPPIKNGNEGKGSRKRVERERKKKYSKQIRKNERSGKIQST